MAFADDPRFDYLDLDTVAVVGHRRDYLGLGKVALDDHLRNYHDLDKVFEVCRRHDCRDPDMAVGVDPLHDYHDPGRAELDDHRRSSPDLDKVVAVYRRRLGCKDDLRLHDFVVDHLDHADTALILDSNLGEVAPNALRLVFRNLKHRAKGSLRCCWKGENHASGRACLDHKVVECWKKT